MDWWPISLYVNNERAPFDDKDVRWALSYFIDRQQIVEVGYLGAPRVSPLPHARLPGAAALHRCGQGPPGEVQHAGVRPEEGRGASAPEGLEEGRQRASGPTPRATSSRWTSSASERAGPAIGPVLAELLKRQGVDARLSLPPDFDDRFQKGQYAGAIYGHGGSVNDPYHTLRLYQSSTVAVPGGHLVNFSRWKNAAYDKIVDEVFVTDTSDKPKLTELFRKAMEIWLPELPDIPLVHNYPPHPDEHDLLDRTGRPSRDPLRQRRVLAPDLSRWCSGTSSRPSSDRASVTARRSGCRAGPTTVSHPSRGRRSEPPRAEKPGRVR